MLKHIQSIVFQISITILLLSVLFTGCGALYTGSPVVGALVTNVQAPVAVNPGAFDIYHLKIGSSSATSILGLIATGDASIRAAVVDGGISEIYFVDSDIESLLGIFTTYTIVVYGK